MSKFDNDFNITDEIDYAWKSTDDGAPMLTSRETLNRFAALHTEDKSTVLSMRRTLKYLQKQFGLPSYRRLIIDKQAKKVHMAREYPRWMLELSIWVPLVE